MAQTLASRSLHAVTLLADTTPLYCWRCTRTLSAHGWHLDAFGDPECNDIVTCKALSSEQERAECVPGELDDDEEVDLSLVECAQCGARLDLCVDEFAFDEDGLVVCIDDKACSWRAFWNEHSAGW